MCACASQSTVLCVHPHTARLSFVVALHPRWIGDMLSVSQVILQRVYAGRTVRACGTAVPNVQGKKAGRYKLVKYAMAVASFRYTCAGCLVDPVSAWINSVPRSILVDELLGIM